MKGEIVQLINCSKGICGFSTKIRIFEKQHNQCETIIHFGITLEMLKGKTLNEEKLSEALRASSMSY